jgi:hypothetical protein
MSRLPLRSGLVAFAGFWLMSFSIGPVTSPPRLYYDVRDAFVAARPDISPALMLGIDRQVGDAIEATDRPLVLPRVVLTVRLDRVERTDFLLGTRHTADVTVKAASVATGEVVAAAVFDASAFALDAAVADAMLADRISQRIRREFRLSQPLHDHPARSRQATLRR